MHLKIRMINFIFFSLLTFAMMSLRADDIAPSQFNVYAIGNVGSSSNPYSNSGFQGITGAGGSVFLTNFGVNGGGPSALYSIYTGQSANLTNTQVTNGGVQAAGNVNMSGSAVYGSVTSGGNLTGSSGNITGNATLTGTNSSTVTINGTVKTAQPFTPTENLTSVSQYFQNASQIWNNLTPTVSSVINGSGQVAVSTLAAGRNILNISLASLDTANAILLNGPSNAFLVINVSGSGTLNYLSLLGNLPSQDLLLNFMTSSPLTISGGNFSILAPNSTVNFPGGGLTGNLIVGNLTGTGQVNQGAFTGFTSSLAVPEPPTYILLGGLLLIVAALVYFGRKVRQHSQ